MWIARPISCCACSLRPDGEVSGLRNTSLNRLKPAAVSATVPTTKGAALQALKEYVAGRPGEREQFQVVPMHELEEV